LSSAAAEERGDEGTRKQTKRRLQANSWNEGLGFGMMIRISHSMTKRPIHA